MDEVGIEVSLHGLADFVGNLSPHDADVLVENGAKQALDEAVGLEPVHRRRVQVNGDRGLTPAQAVR